MAFLPLPGMLGERLFSIWDVDQDQALNLEDFVAMMAILLRGTDEARYRLLYDVCTGAAGPVARPAPCRSRRRLPAPCAPDDARADV